MSGQNPTWAEMLAEWWKAGRPMYSIDTPAVPDHVKAVAREAYEQGRSDMAADALQAISCLSLGMDLPATISGIRDHSASKSPEGE